MKPNDRRLKRRRFERKMMHEFPDLFRDMDKDEGTSCMYWGIAIGPGWNRLFYQMCKDIQAHLDQVPEMKKVWKFEQVKEKWGQLRVYASPVSPICEKIIDKAERASAFICESCGKKGRLMSDGWVVCLCYYCAKKRMLRNKEFEKRVKLNEEERARNPPPPVKHTPVEVTFPPITEKPSECP